MKYLISVLTDPTESRGNMVKVAHAILYAMELKKNGHDVLIHFDGGGIKTFENESLRKYIELAIKEGIVYGACGYCASPSHIGGKEKIEKIGVRLIGNESSHIGIAELINEGYYPIIM
ncbi:hypothetical protein GFS03_03935 [Sulfolobus sp. E5-1-F]|uniref:hypothetical protein n=1 Tax=Saccharolobus sp. E5-1-F TaxID=2663019 RepID=UPI001297E07B|nr:hypothetical protein [Sulfolobus sp. E5-1-F]QGA53795.1 hypothetical protein GFS03_03935 [Sulfolobus sp. E5-1-F]